MIELLVVVAILALLAALLYPVLAAARERGRIAVCANNLKQIGTAMTLYAQDWEETYPSARTWEKNGILFNPNFSLIPYLKSYRTWHCPSDPWVYYLAGYPWFVETSYLYSEYFFGRLDCPRPLAAVESPSESIMFSEGTLGGTYMPRVYERVNTESNTIPLIGGWHKGKNNYLFADGRVEFLSVWKTLQPKPLWENFGDWCMQCDFCAEDAWDQETIEESLKKLEGYKGIFSW